jgi:hypothetical protein
MIGYHRPGGNTPCKWTVPGLVIHPEISLVRWTA